MILSQNIAEEYAHLFSLSLRGPGEAAWQFRVRVASTLEQMGETIRAHEALWNEWMSSDPSATGTLARGYGQDFIATVAKYVESVYQAQRALPGDSSA